MKKTKLFIIPIVALITLISVSSLFAISKPSTKYYGVYSETYQGANVRDWGDVSDENTVNIALWEGTIACANNNEFNSRPEFLLNDKDEDGNYKYDYSKTPYGSYEVYNSSVTEGGEYLRFLYKAGWIGAAFTRANGRTIDMSNYAGGMLKFSARSMASTMHENGGVKDAEVGFTTKSGGDKLLGKLSSLTTEWTDFTFEIPNDMDLSDVTSLFVLFQNKGIIQTGNDIDIDNIRWERNVEEEIDVTGVSFSAELQGGSEGKIMWYTDGTDISTIEKDWKVVEDEYINLKITKFLDKDGNEYPIGEDGKYVTSYPFSSSSLERWKFRIYTSSGTKSGLLPYEKQEDKFVYYEKAESLPLCWRLVDSNLSDFTISEFVDSEGNTHLQDSNGWSCWLYIQNKGSNDYEDSYAIIWNKDGFRGSEGDYYGAGFDATPRLYIGANFKNAIGALKYESIIVIECSNE